MNNEEEKVDVAVGAVGADDNNDAPEPDSKPPKRKPKLVLFGKSRSIKSEDDKPENSQKRYSSFEDVLTECQLFMTENRSGTISGTIDEEKTEVLKQQIGHFLRERRFYVNGLTLQQLTENLYINMFEYGFLTPYLGNPDVEEININAWNCIIVQFVGKEPEIIDDCFFSPEHAVDIVRRLLHHNGIVFDVSNPLAYGFLGTNTRITALHSKIVGDKAGVAVSIRVVNPHEFKVSDFIAKGTLNQPMYELLQNLIRFRTSIIFGGNTGSGKTTLMAALLKCIPNSDRIYTAEQAVREFDLNKYDEKGNIVNDVVSTVTVKSDDVKRSVSLSNLVTTALTMHPTYIVCGEMKDAEAWDVQEAARTGHTAFTTAHAKNAGAVHTRLLTLCLMKYSMLPASLITRFVCEAFPIIVFVNKDMDGVRRVKEIAECHYEGGENYSVKTLWKFDTADIIEDESGNVKEVVGEFVRENGISEELARDLSTNGMPRRIIEELKKGGQT
jgi:pilus assembly protein CpaF